MSGGSTLFAPSAPSCSIFKHGRWSTQSGRGLEQQPQGCSMSLGGVGEIERAPSTLTPSLIFRAIWYEAGPNLRHVRPGRWSSPKTMPRETPALDFAPSWILKMEQPPPRRRPIAGTPHKTITP